MYLELKDRINEVMEMGSVPADKQKEHKGFKDWVSGSSRRDHPSIVQVFCLIEASNHIYFMLC